MPIISAYNWSELDRYSLIERLSVIAPEVVDKSLPAIEFSKIVRSCLRSYDIPVKVFSSFNKETLRNWVYVGGLYDSYKDVKNQRSISIELQYRSNTSKIKISQRKFRRISTQIADTLMHEIIHMRQYRRRKFKAIPGYESTASSGRKRSEQIYLGHSDEIDAYAFNIACNSYDRYGNNLKKITKYLNSDFNDKRIGHTSYKMYLEAFDHNHNHKIIKKLKKRIIYYIPDAELGKPYKTKDWLK